MKTIDARGKNLRALNRALKDSVNGNPVKVRNAGHVSGLGAGFKHGEIIVESEIGNGSRFTMSFPVAVKG